MEHRIRSLHFSKCLYLSFIESTVWKFLIFLHANPFVTSGFVEVGETVEAATIREVQEETNLRLSRLVMDYPVISTL
jgi:NUDIX domain